MRHGAGRLAGQYYFAARTGRTNLMEGTIEIVLGLFFASSTAELFGAFPQFAPRPLRSRSILFAGLPRSRKSLS